MMTDLQDSSSSTPQDSISVEKGEEESSPIEQPSTSTSTYSPSEEQAVKSEPVKEEVEVTANHDTQSIPNQITNQPESISQPQPQPQPTREEAVGPTPTPPSPSASASTPETTLTAEDSQSRDTAFNSRNQQSSPQQTYQPQQQARKASNGNGNGNGSGPQALPAPNAQSIRPLQQQQQRPPMMIRLRVLSIEKAGRDLVVRMDSVVNHPAYRLSSYSFSRSYRELSLFTLSLSLSLPSTIIPFLPFLPPPLSLSSPNPQDLDSDLKSLRIQLSQWFNRLLTNPQVFNHPELRSLIETEFSYLPSTNPSIINLPSPISKKKLTQAIEIHRNGGSVNPLAIADLGYENSNPNGNSTGSLPGGIGIGSSVMNQFFSSSSSTVSSGGKMGTSRNVFDDDELLVAARAEVTRLELQFKDAGTTLGKRSNESVTMSSSLHGLSGRILGFMQVEEGRQASLKVGFGKGLEAVGRGVAIEGVGNERQSSLDLHHLSHALLYQSLNARSAKEALLTRNGLVEEHHNASKSVISRRREIDVLRTSRNIRRERVDEKVEELEDSLRIEAGLKEQMSTLSAGLKGSLQVHSKETHRDLIDGLKRLAQDRLKTSREVLKNFKVMKEGLDRIGKDWKNVGSENGRPITVEGVARNGYGYGNQGSGITQTNPRQVSNPSDASESSSSDSIGTITQSIDPRSSPEVHARALPSQTTPQKQPQRQADLTSPALLRTSSQTRSSIPNSSPTPWSRESQTSESRSHSPSQSLSQTQNNSFNQAEPSMQIPVDRRDMNQSWHQGRPTPPQAQDESRGQFGSKSMLVERPNDFAPGNQIRPQQQQQQQQQQQESQWEGMPSNSSFASRFGTLGSGNRGPSTSESGNTSRGPSFGAGASAYGNPFASNSFGSSGSASSSTPSTAVNSNPNPSFNSARGGLNSGALNSGGGSFGSANGGLNRSRISASDAAKQLAGRF